MIVNQLEEKKGENITLMDIRNIASFADYFIFCNGTSDRMLQNLAETVQKYARNELGIKCKLEGNPGDEWIALDLGDIVLHLLTPERRNYYQIEQLWEKGKIILHYQ